MSARGDQIRRAQRAAAQAQERQLNALVRELRRAYESAVDSILAGLSALADADDTIPVHRLPEAEQVVRSHLAALNSQREQMLQSGLASAASSVSHTWATAGALATGRNLTRDVIDWLHEFRSADGSQLSDRLWRLDRGARDSLMDAVERAIIEGHSAHQAARNFVTRGQSVPADLLSKEGQAAVRNIQRQAADSVFRELGNPYTQAEKVFRTEINRAFGETAIAAATDHPDVVALKFRLSPNHPRPDICDYYATANLHGLGAGVYPKDDHPWPAHPSTLSYMDPVFRDEISTDDQRGRQTVTDFFNSQPADRQDAMLGGKAKGWAWRAGHLDPRQIRTPWRDVAATLQRRGVDIPEEFAP